MLNILGIDYGSKRVGLALGDPEKKMAFPFEVIENKNRKYLLEKIKDVCLRENIKEVVVGLPVSLKGEEKNKQIMEVKKFVAALSAVCHKDVKTEDERFTSKMVESLRKEADGGSLAEKDSIEAMLMLESYLAKTEQPKTEKQRN